MFGYIKPLESELKVKELDLYKAVYCGLCDTLSEEYGICSRFTLSFDFTFTAMIMMGLNQTPPEIAVKSCVFNPLSKKKPHVIINDSLRYNAHIATMMIWAKNVDNAQDSHFPKSFLWKLSLPLTSRIAQKTAVESREAFEHIAEVTTYQKEVESNENATMDSACDPTARLISKLLELMSDDVQEKRILSRMGYMIGRYCYICDAIDDLDKDIKSNNFNPLKSGSDKERLYSLINSTISETIKAYELLDIKHFKEILDNIIYLGLQSNANQLINRRENIEGSI